MIVGRSEEVWMKTVKLDEIIRQILKWKMAQHTDPTLQTTEERTRQPLTLVPTQHAH